jgi:LPXTG-motif cell wall-anchored protein
VRRGVAGIGAAGIAGAITTTVLALGPNAAGGWTTAPGSGLPGAAVRIESSGELCVWDETLPDGSAVTRYEGVRVEIRLGDRQLGAVPVAPGGDWGGTLRVPAVAAGTYPLAARCIVVDPALPGGRTVDFAPRTFAVAEAPPPTSATTAPPVVIPPPAIVTAAAPTATPTATRRPTAPRATLPNTGPATLPNTGDGTLAVALAGFGSLGIGAAALWWGRKRPVPADRRSG